MTTPKTIDSDLTCANLSGAKLMIENAHAARTKRIRCDSEEDIDTHDLFSWCSSAAILYDDFEEHIQRDPTCGDFEDRTEITRTIVGARLGTLEINREQLEQIIGADGASRIEECATTEANE